MEGRCATLRLTVLERRRRAASSTRDVAPAGPVPYACLSGSGDLGCSDVVEGTTGIDAPIGKDHPG